MTHQVHDFEINQMVQKVLSKHKLDLANLKFTARGGIVYFEGMVTALGDDSLMSVSGKTMEVVDHEITHIDGVRRVRYNLLNMTKTDSGWRHIKFIKSESRLVWKVGGSPLSKGGEGAITKHEET